MSTSPLQNAGTGWRARPEARWALGGRRGGTRCGGAVGEGDSRFGRVHCRDRVSVRAVRRRDRGDPGGHLWGGAAALPAAIGYEVWRGLTLERAVGEALAMDAAQLERIASLDNAELFEPMGSLWDLKGENRKGLAVMRLVARHHAAAATLARLEAHPRAERLLTELLANPNMPAAVLAKHASDTLYLAEWGLALNPNTPPEVMERLSRSENLYTRMNLTYNKATPRELLLRLAQDPDPLLAHNARLALERH
jgi:hypothetical protein